MPETTVESEVTEVAEKIQQPANSAAEPASLALSVDEFTALEERVLRAVNLVKRERVARESAETHVKELEAKLVDHTTRINEHEEQILEQLGQVEQLQGEVKSLRSEREHVRERVERLLSQLDALEI